MVLAPSWLTARPIAHRGLHNDNAGRVENSLAAARAAIAGNYAIECDIQLSSDGEAIVFHDDTLERLTNAQGRLDTLSRQALTGLRFRDSSETIPALQDLLALVAGQVPLIIEIKSGFDGNTRLAETALACVASYSGPLAIKSFDPAPLLYLRTHNIERPIGLVAEAFYTVWDWPELTGDMRVDLMALTAYPALHPDFLSWNVKDLPHAVPILCRHGIGMPVMTWTVRTQEQRDLASRFADQIVFEGFSA
ncbi:glycerophosphodiester phosphodiesterase family protein [Beijerinckia indica]|uniref:Glycerophosphoryl diester phosphodiesterase n=1 Tax=Beijerinckia indica subsp. indica (strain ATCC 9039 / DSM 1715 / NCIMB 8712) TaxID=395963 RepID=B2IDI5_BEII9|nr:glycerophosphodiester phosphodiesterase family protein [Beijerinckia indica]ACB95421.1 glycerophosphoryl diester phosphodiesterase [Beijerinckia indica subsp. indica ATCC 9039]